MKEKRYKREKERGKERIKKKETENFALFQI